MAIGFDIGGGIDPENLEGSDRPKPGKYLVMIQDVEENDNFFKVTFEILRGNVPDMEGKLHTERIYWRNKEGVTTDGSKRRILLFHTACGLETVESLSKKKENNEQFNMQFESSVGRKMVIDLEEQTNDDTKKTYTNITFSGFIHPKDPKAEGVVGCGPNGSETPGDGAGGGGDFGDVF